MPKWLIFSLLCAMLYHTLPIYYKKAGFSRRIINNPAASSGVCCFGKVSVSGFNTLWNAPRGGVLNPSHTIIYSVIAEYFKTDMLVHAPGRGI